MIKEVFIAMVFIAVSAVTFAEQITDLIEFEDGTPASAGQVNSNFSKLSSESNSQDTRLDAVEALIEIDNSPISYNYLGASDQEVLPEWYTALQACKATYGVAARVLSTEALFAGLQSGALMPPTGWVKSVASAIDPYFGVSLDLSAGAGLITCTDAGTLKQTRPYGGVSSAQYCYVNQSRPALCMEPAN